MHTPTTQARRQRPPICHIQMSCSSLLYLFSLLCSSPSTHRARPTPQKRRRRRREKRKQLKFSSSTFAVQSRGGGRGACQPQPIMLGRKKSSGGKDKREGEKKVEGCCDVCQLLRPHACIDFFGTLSRNFFINLFFHITRNEFCSVS